MVDRQKQSIQIGVPVKSAWLRRTSQMWEHVVFKMDVQEAENVESWKATPREASDEKQ